MLLPNSKFHVPLRASNALKNSSRHSYWRPTIVASASRVASFARRSQRNWQERRFPCETSFVCAINADANSARSSTIGISYSLASIEYLRRWGQFAIKIDPLLTSKRLLGFHFERSLEQSECVGDHETGAEMDRQSRSVQTGILRCRREVRCKDY